MSKHYGDQAVPVLDDPRHPPADAPLYLGDLPLKIMLAGLANCTSATVTGPTDLIKVRQQLETSKGQSSSFVQIARLMFRNEGLLSYWKGWSAAMLRESSYSGIRMGAYDFMKAQFPASQQTSFFTKLSSGLASGMLGAAIANPADLIKVRMQALNNDKGLFQHFKNIYHTSGIKGYYRGLVPTVLRAGLLTSSQLGTYDHAKHTLLDSFPNYFGETFKTHLVASGIAGFTCSVVSAPVDTIKVRVMNDRRYKSAIDCTYQIVRNEGPLALYKGLFMCFLRLWPHTVVALVIYEKLRALAGLKPV